MLFDHVGTEHSYASVDAAVTAFQAQPAPAEALPIPAPESA